MARFYYGGQAVIEGVMMRGRTHMAVAVRNPKGEIIVHQEPLTARVYTSRWGQWPFVRGLAMLWDALVLGMRALLWSADVAMAEEKVEFKGPVAWTTVAGSLALGIGIFFLFPSVLAHWLERFWPSPVASSVVEGIVRLALFLAYVRLIGLMPDIRRVFAYHGAEHKAINALEAGAELTPASVARFSTAHIRCGTSFLLLVLILAILFHIPLQFPQWYLRLLSRVLVIPLIAGVAYEFIRFSADHQSHPLVRLFVLPGLTLQRLTTREPDLEMLEVAICALKPVLVADGVLTSEVSTAETASLAELPATA
ncbi:MAG: DUF1385 domain-containing protein [Anaerolineae bacterium]|nr:DUF1385 domain-containing protein [Anaerolineae bacterium]MDW8099502.1 DUF1385 domain-containing protein [Anaerolineae bacterium]